MTERENLLRTIRFERPDHIRMSFVINPACWHHYDQNAFQDLMEAHPFLFPGFKRQETVTPQLALNQRKDAPYTDPWGCVWKTEDDGITGAVHGHPLEDWSALDSYTPPDPAETDGTFPVDWEGRASAVQSAKDHGALVFMSLPHGHTFLRLQDIRGYANLMIDMANEDPRLDRLIGMVADFNCEYVLRCLELAPDVMGYGEDLGMQVGPMLSPDHFRKYIKPVYHRLMAPARERSCAIHMHSDGDIRTLASDMVEAGVDVLNLQDLVNGIDWIAERFAGKTCIDLDIDRQRITPYGTPKEIDALIREEVEKLGSPEGGLMMKYGLYPGVPLENAAALMDAMTRYADYYSG